MGGLFAGVYAANYPSEVRGLSLLCPVGIRCPKETEVMKRLKELCANRVTENIPFIPLNIQQGEELLIYGTYNHIKLPKQSGSQLEKVGFQMVPSGSEPDGYEKECQNELYVFFIIEKDFFDMFSDESLYSLHDNMSKIKAPTQIIWGENDRASTL
ncbi:UNVERIFIED_CONTAM: hypothetical protein K2H54_058733 [Gekko kuhli]